MKKKVFLLLMILIASFSLHAAVNKTVIKGQVPRYEGKGYLLLMDEATRRYDTINVNHDGHFTHVIDISAPAYKALYLEYLGDDRGLVRMYLIPGKKLEVTITGEYETRELLGMKLTQYMLKPVFKGVTKQECDYLSIPTYFDYYYTDKEGKAISYQEFLNQIKQQQDMRYAKLKGTAKIFYNQQAKIIDDMQDEYRFVYAWQLFNRKLDPSRDADFTAFVNSIDMNRDISSGTISIGGQDNYVSDKIRYLLRLHPELYARQSSVVRNLCFLRDSITNVRTREKLSDALMHNVMATGGNESLKSAWPIYEQLSGKSESFKNNEKIYNSLSKLNPGVEATDFEMQDVNGNIVRFHDVIKRGKITYIDFWATWCGPCCMEIPFVEKLVEKFKGNDNIQFVSISLDNDLKKWHGKLERDKPTWEQYVIPDNFNSKFAKEYNIQGIPRFMIFDGEGKIININEVRPSAENIDDILKGYIQKYCQ